MTRLWQMKRKCNLPVMLLLGLLPGIEPASAEVYTLKVAIHKEVRPRLSQTDIEDILKRASGLMKLPGFNSCDVEFKLGSVQPLKAPAYINDPSTLEAVHSVDANIKVVQKITFCNNQYYKDGVAGCAWRAKGRRTVIVTNNMMALDDRHILWVHEFGHTTGLEHRNRANSELIDPLMTGPPCSLGSNTQLINKDECGHFRAGPVPPPYGPPGPACPQNSSPRPRTD